MAFAPPRLPGQEQPPPSVDVREDLVAAYHAFRAGSHNAAARLWHSSAQRGDVQAANALGWSFDTGDGTGGVSQPEAALLCYEYAASAGWAAAECNLAVHLLYGLGVAVDRSRGIRLLLSSASQGQEVACELLASLIRSDGQWHVGAAVGPWDGLAPEVVLAWAERYPGVAAYLRETGVDYARFGAVESALVLQAAATRIEEEEAREAGVAPAAAAA